MLRANAGQVIAVGLLTLLGTGCHPKGSAGAPGATGTAGPATAARAEKPQPAPVSIEVAQGYSMLYDLMSDESRVGGILILKSATPATKALIKDIAAVSSDAAKRLKPHAGAPVPWPKLELAARAAIEKATRNRLLTSGHDRFEVELLLTQVNATEYGSSLAAELAKMVEASEEQAWLKELSKTYWDLNRRAAHRLTIAP